MKKNKNKRTLEVVCQEEKGLTSLVRKNASTVIYQGISLKENAYTHLDSAVAEYYQQVGIINK